MSDCSEITFVFEEISEINEQVEPAKIPDLAEVLHEIDQLIYGVTQG